MRMAIKKYSLTKSFAFIPGLFSIKETGQTPKIRNDILVSGAFKKLEHSYLSDFEKTADVLKFAIQYLRYINICRRVDVCQINTKLFKIFC